MGPVAALMILVAGLLADARSADAAESPMPAGRGALAVPVTPFTVERLASLPALPWLAGHRGVDLVATSGEPVFAPASGVVSYVGFVVDRPVISIRHGAGLVSSFEPIDSTMTAGDIVARGQTIGTVAGTTSHCAPRWCVHWGLRVGGDYVDPLDYVEGFGPIRLLPRRDD